jgi:hypothetical protein
MTYDNTLDPERPYTPDTYPSYQTTPDLINQYFDQALATGGDVDPYPYVQGHAIESAAQQADWRNQPLPPGWTPEGDRGYLARDQNGDLQSNPAYINHLEQNGKIDWGGVVRDLSGIAIGAATGAGAGALVTRAGAWTRAGGSGAGGDFGLGQIATAVAAAVGSAREAFLDLIRKIKDQEREAAEDAKVN